MKLIVILLCVLFLAGCTDQLRVEPENSLTFGNITKEKDVEALVYGVGAGVRDMVCWNALLQVEKGAYADEADESRRVPGCWNWKLGQLICGKLGIR